MISPMVVLRSSSPVNAHRLRYPPSSTPSFRSHITVAATAAPLPRRRAAVALALLRSAVRESAPLKSTRDTRNGKKKGEFRHLGCYSKVHDVAACMLASTRSVKRRDEWSLRLPARSVLSAPCGGWRGRCFLSSCPLYPRFYPYEARCRRDEFLDHFHLCYPQEPLVRPWGQLRLATVLFRSTMLSTLIESRTTTTFHALSIIK